MSLSSTAFLIGIIMKAMADKYNEIKYIIDFNDKNRKQKEDIRQVGKVKLGPLQRKKANTYTLHYGVEANSSIADLLIQFFHTELT